MQIFTVVIRAHDIRLRDPGLALSREAVAEVRGDERAWRMMNKSAPSGERTPRRPPSGGRQSVSVKLEEVVGGGDEPPFGPDRASASSVEAGHAAIVFGLTEDGLDHRLAAAVELAAALAGQDAAHEVVVAAGPSRPRCLAFARIRWDEHLAAGGVRAFHLTLVPVAGVGQHDTGRFLKADPLKLAARGVEHRL